MHGKGFSSVAKSFLSYLIFLNVCFYRNNTEPGQRREPSFEEQPSVLLCLPAHGQHKLKGRIPSSDQRRMLKRNVPLVVVGMVRLIKVGLTAPHTLLTTNRYWSVLNYFKRAPLIFHISLCNVFLLRPETLYSLIYTPSNRRRGYRRGVQSSLYLLIMFMCVFAQQYL